jgi:glycine cleavage system regulatory protein
MTKSIVLTVISDDHPGIVNSLSDLVVAHGGNWTESSMLSLAGKFAGVLLADLPDQQADACVTALEALNDKGMQIVVQQSSGPQATESLEEFELDLVGQDHPGIVQEITGILAKHDTNVLELETHCQSASMSGENLFLAHARFLVPSGASVEALQDELEDLANELMVEINLKT